MGEELLALVDEARKEHESSAKLKKVSADGKEEKNREANNDDEEATGRLTAAEEKQLLFRNVSLLWAVSMLFEWLQLPERGGLPVRKRKELRERLIAVNKIDKAMPDPLLIAGLIDYYFARNDEERRAAVEELRGALKLGLTVPEVVRLVKAEDKLEVVARDALKLFCNLYRSYLENRTIPLRVRQDLKKKFEKYKAFKSIGEEVDLGEEDDAIQPSIVDIQSREALMRGRLERIVVPRLGRAKAEHAKKVRDQLDGLRECIEALGDHLTKVENTQQEALGSMGEFLLHEEEIPAGDDVKSKKKGRDVFSDIGGALEIEKRKTKATPEDEEEKNND